MDKSNAMSMSMYALRLFPRLVIQLQNHRNLSWNTLCVQTTLMDHLLLPYFPLIDQFREKLTIQGKKFTSILRCTIFQFAAVAVRENKKEFFVLKFMPSTQILLGRYFMLSRQVSLSTVFNETREYFISSPH